MTNSECWVNFCVDDGVYLSDFSKHIIYHKIISFFFILYPFIHILSPLFKQVSSLSIRLGYEIFYPLHIN